ncbi:MAG: transposase [Chloroflexi bacterium]|nr:transposase [Chloroflexota bacterium]
MASRCTPTSAKTPHAASSGADHLPPARGNHRPDGLLEHETELDPRTVYTDTHGYTEVVMAIGAR